MNKKVLIIGISVLLLISIGALFFVNKSKKVGESIPSTEALLVDNQIRGLVPTSQSIVYFNKEKKTFFELKDGKAIEQFNIDYEPITIIYSPDRTKALLFGDVEEIGRPIDLINFETVEKKTLANGVISAAFSPDSQNLVLFFKDYINETAGLYRTDLSLQNKAKIKDLVYSEGLNYLLSWPEQEYVWTLMAFPEIVDVKLSKVKVLDGSTITIGDDKFADFKVAPNGLDVVGMVMTNPAEMNFSGLRTETEYTSFNDKLLVNTPGNGWIDTGLMSNIFQVAWTNENKLLTVANLEGQPAQLYSVNPEDGKYEEWDIEIPQDVYITEMVLVEFENKLYILNDKEPLIIDLSK